jgi:hypothetical protein
MRRPGAGAFRFGARTDYGPVRTSRRWVVIGEQPIQKVTGPSSGRAADRSAVRGSPLPPLKRGLLFGP